MDLTTSESQMHAPHDAASGLFRVTPSFPATINPGVSSQGGLLADPSIPPTHAGSHTQPPWTHSARVTSHMGAQRPQSHMVPCSGTQAGTHSYRVTHKRTQSHGHTQSHGRTQAHTQARLTQAQVTLVPTPHAAGTPSPPACMLTVVLELGHPYTKSLPLIPALGTSLLRALLPTSSSLILVAGEILLPLC